MSNQSMIEHILTICDEYKSVVDRHSMLFSMYAGGNTATGEEIVKKQAEALDHFEQEAFVAISRIRAFLDVDTLRIQKQELTSDQILMLKEVVKGFKNDLPVL